ncbi:hypothetical protein SDC9_186464 [bioreactor metagenome]|uniref:Uncharacterized protein n=1 Tax=bioreactor metagenome TaxID=1076179 RepID=A0A645HL38_9ZZZZ
MVAQLRLVTLAQLADLEPVFFGKQHHADIVHVDRSLQLQRVDRIARGPVGFQRQSQHPHRSSLEQRGAALELGSQRTEEMQVVADTGVFGLGNRGLRRLAAHAADHRRKTGNRFDQFGAIRVDTLAAGGMIEL